MISDVATSFMGILYVSLVVGLRNIVFGVVHFVFDGNYVVKLYCLLLIEGVFMVVHLLALWSTGFRKAVVYFKSKVWMCSIMPGMMRIFLNFTFLLTEWQTNDNESTIDGDKPQ